MQADVAARSRLLLDYRTIIERRIKIEADYLTRMRELAALPEMKKIPNATKATEFLYNSLVNAMHAELDNIGNHVTRLEGEIGRLIAIACSELEGMVRK